VKIHFEGTMAEFQALFYGFADDDEEGGFQPSGRARPPAFSVVSVDDDDDDPLTEEEEPEDNGRVLPLPAPVSAEPAALTATLTDEERSLGWAKFCAVCKEWTVNFDKEGEQPDRMQLLGELGSGPYPKAVLVMAYEIGSLQRLVGKALLEETGQPRLGLETVEAYQDFIDQIAANMVQISHLVFPDLAGTYDYSTKWKRSK
jgi:hypothetical protein